MAISNILWQFGTHYWRLVYVFCGHFVHSTCFGMFCQETSGNPAEKIIKLVSKKRKGICSLIERSLNIVTLKMDCKMVH
jgi:hypothetical protein